MAFEKGQTVMLKSGGPIMVVTTPTQEKTYVCQWWNPLTGQLSTATFGEHLIRSVAEPDTAEALEYQLRLIDAFRR